MKKKPFDPNSSIRESLTDLSKAPMARDPVEIDEEAIRQYNEGVRSRQRKERNKRAIENIKDSLRYQSEVDFREAMRKARANEYKKRGF